MNTKTQLPNSIFFSTGTHRHAFQRFHSIQVVYLGKGILVRWDYQKVFVYQRGCDWHRQPILPPLHSYFNPPCLSAALMLFDASDSATHRLYWHGDGIPISWFIPERKRLGLWAAGNKRLRQVSAWKSKLLQPNATDKYFPEQ